MTKSDIILNVEDGSIISELTSTLTAPAQSFVFGDILDLQITGVAPNEGSDSADKPWKPIDMAGKEFRVAIGTQDRLPFAGSFTINSSAQIAYNATGTTVETALNADATIASEGGVSVSALSQGGWRVTYNTTGAKTAIAGNENSLLPSAQIYADILRAGDGSTKEAWMIRVETSPSAYAELTDDIAQPTITATQVRNGNDATGISEVQSFAIVGTPTSGTFALVLDSVATGEIAYDADSISITEAIEDHPLITGEDLVSVIGTAKDFTVTFDSSLGDLSAISADASNLAGLNGTRGQFSLNTNEIVELLNGAGTSSALFEVVLFDTDNSRGKTVHQSQVTINQDVIPDTPPSVTPIKQYAELGHTHVISDVTGLQGALDASAAHEADVTTNPHAVTAAQVGLSTAAADIVDLQNDTLDLTTAQTAAGDKTFTGQMQATGQVYTDEDSVITSSIMAKAAAYKSGSNQVLPAGVATKVIFDAEESDVNGAFSSSTFTVPANFNGFVAITAGVLILAGSATVGALYVYKNGSQYKRLYDRAIPAAAHQSTHGGTFFFSAGDTIEIHQSVLATRTILAASTVTFASFACTP